MENHMRSGNVKPLVPASLLAKIAGHCVGTARDLLLADGTTDTDVEVANTAVEMARLIVLRAHKVACDNNALVGEHSARRSSTEHYRLSGGKVVPVGLGASVSEDDTLDEDMDPINGG